MGAGFQTDVERAALGCFASHVGLMREFLAGPHAHCLVLEDDAIVPADFRRVVEALIASPACGDMTMLYGNRPGLAVKTASLGDGQHDVVGYFGKQTGTVAYLINRKAAQAYEKLIRELFSSENEQVLA